MNLDTKHVGKLLLGSLSCRVRSSNVIHVYPRKFSLRVVFTKSTSTLGSLVVHVLGMRSKPKVVWINARWVVSVWAIVKNVYAFRNWPTVKNPRSPVSVNFRLLSFLVKPAVSGPLARANPQPTRFGLFNLLPKSFREALGKTLRSQILGRNLDHSSVTNAVRVTGPAAFIVVKPTKRSKSMSNA